LLSSIGIGQHLPALYSEKSLLLTLLPLILLLCWLFRIRFTQSLSVGDSDWVLDLLAAALARDRSGTTSRYAQATKYRWHGWRKLTAADDSSPWCK
jgi:hypothetical protein